jgi:hypothetical protein
LLLGNAEYHLCVVTPCGSCRRNVREGGILHSYRHENLKSYKVFVCLPYVSVLDTYTVKTVTAGCPVKSGSSYNFVRLSISLLDGNLRNSVITMAFSPANERINFAMTGIRCSTVGIKDGKVAVYLLYGVPVEGSPWYGSQSPLFSHTIHRSTTPV